MPIENDPWHSPDDDQTPGQPDEQEPHGSEHGKRGKKRKRKMSLSQYYAKNPDKDPYYRSKPPPKVPYSHASPKPLTPNSGYVPPPPPTPEQRQKDTVGLMYFFIVATSIVLGSCSLLSNYGLEFEVPGIPPEKVEERIVRLYTTGYDPMMTTHGREAWVEHNNSPELMEVADIRYESGGPVITVLVERDGEMQIDLISIYYSGNIGQYSPNFGRYSYEEYAFSEAAIEIDSSVYPKTVDEIPEEYTK